MKWILSGLFLVTLLVSCGAQPTPDAETLARGMLQMWAQQTAAAAPAVQRQAASVTRTSLPTQLPTPVPTSSPTRILTPTSTTRPQPAHDDVYDRIVFSFSDDELAVSEGIFSINVDGSELTNLTNTLDTSEYLLSCSPDGRRIAFLTSSGGCDNLYAMSADGTGRTRLYDCTPGTHLGNAAWSPEGGRLAFVTQHQSGGNFDLAIHIVNADGSGPTTLSDSGVCSTWVAWSPDGRRIAYLAFGDNFYAMNADGTEKTRLTNGAYVDSTGWAWSPDGSRIAFFSDLNGLHDICVVNADGSEWTRVVRTSTDSYDFPHISWSPDGRRIAFADRRDGNLDIYTINVDGTGELRLTDAPGPDSMPSWSRDGNHIAFVSSREHAYALYVMNADGSNQTYLTRSVGWTPIWCP